ncbi:type II secretion system protein [Candidatus Nomurabacteria bacterium]|nr:type II secretion system protein [Candidatus Nomurabacteria bacterium]
MIKKITNFKFVIRNCKKGMTYVELIVVLGIFSMLSAVAIFNYGDFQSNVDIKNLASDVATKVVEAQKASMSGVLPQSGGYEKNWKPSYGVYFDTASDAASFIYFADLNQDNLFGDADSSCSFGGECIDKINITKGNSIATLGVVYEGDDAVNCVDNLTISFKRPNSSAVLVSNKEILRGVSYAQVTLTSPKGKTSNIKLYTSGRIQVSSAGSLLKCMVRGRL